MPELFEVNFATIEDESTWSCVPTRDSVQRMIGCLAGFVVLAGVVAPAAVLLLVQARIFRLGVVVFTAAVWVLLAFVIWVACVLWRESRLALIADRREGTLNHGPQRLCRLVQISRVDALEDPSSIDVRTFAIWIRLTDGSAAPLPRWFQTLSPITAEAVRASLTRFLTAEPSGVPAERPPSGADGSRARATRRSPD